jgi:hypothetical protein
VSAPLPPWARRPLSAPAGAILEHGEPRIASRLAEAFREASHEDPDTLTHGFHTWPARMHPAMARALIEVGPSEGGILDPFMGGGTVLLEARVLGRSSLGVDLNPIAERVARVRCDPPPAETRALFLAKAEEIAERSEQRVRTRQPALARLPAQMISLYSPHILKELAGLLEEIRKEEARRSRETFETVFSSLVVKLSHKKADTSDDLVEKRLRKGLPTELFLKKCRELVDRWGHLEAALLAAGSRASAPILVRGDSRELPRLLNRALPEHAKIAAIVTSPPYGGTYDYQAQHALRLAWLGIDATSFSRGEIGARSATAPDAVQRWNDELLEVLRAMREVLPPEGRILMVIGDGEIRREPVPALAQVRELSPHADLELVAAASVERPSWGQGPPREEHALALRPRRRR